MSYRFIIGLTLVASIFNYFIGKSLINKNYLEMLKKELIIESNDFIKKARMGQTSTRRYMERWCQFFVVMIKPLTVQFLIILVLFKLFSAEVSEWRMGITILTWTPSWFAVYFVTYIASTRIMKLGDKSGQ
jgi:hypothetical protein